MRKIIAIFVFILMAAALVSCSAKNQEQAIPQTDNTVENNTAIVEQTVPVVEATKEQAQSQAAVTQAVSSQQATSSPAAEVSVKPTNEEIQKALKNAGLYNGTIDGVIGKKTRAAIEDFQTKNNLQVDGKVGPKTWEALKIYLSAPQANSASE
ncbi:MAG TPA: peptidoglycan-binding domain-containing protein [Candidatus Omnitrophota bacterium]|nr:peptidoglycan-binding domain-containing protein [Candidatus Omnitrophota bacterium]